MALLAPTTIDGSVTGGALPVDDVLSDLRRSTSDTAVQSNATPRLAGDRLTRDGVRSLSRLSGSAVE